MKKAFIVLSALALLFACTPENKQSDGGNSSSGSPGRPTREHHRFLLGFDLEESLIGLLVRIGFFISSVLHDRC